MAGLSALADRPASTLDYGNQRRLEIARAAALRPGLPPPRRADVGHELGRVVADGRSRAAGPAIGAGVLVIDHDLGFITNIREHITVLDQGVILAEGNADEIQRDPRVIEAYLGVGQH